MKSNKSLPKTNKTENNFEKFPKNHVFCYKKYFSIEKVVKYQKYEQNSVTQRTIKQQIKSTREIIKNSFENSSMSGSRNLRILKNSNKN